MRRFLLLMTLLPTIAAFVLAHFLGIRSVKKVRYLSFTLGELLEKLKSSSAGSMIHYDHPKKQWAANPITKQGVALISEQSMNSKNTSEVALELSKIGLSLIHRTHEPMVKWRVKVVKSGYYLPLFIGLIAFFGTISGKLPIMWTLIAFSSVLAGCCVMLWISRAVAVEAAESIIYLFEKNHLLPRLYEEEQLIEAIRAWVWVGLIPGILIPLMTKQSLTDAARD